MRLWPWPRKKQDPIVVKRHDTEGLHFGAIPDPMDPHGDGTIRPGDPMWQVFAEAARTGQPVVGHFYVDGSVHVEPAEKRTPVADAGPVFTDSPSDAGGGDCGGGGGD